jgi:hypothetical protein
MTSSFTFIPRPLPPKDLLFRRSYKMVSTLPEDPDPGYDGCRFLQWIKKRGNTRSFRHCTLKARELGFDASSFIKTMHPEQIAIRMSSDGQKVISLNDLPWADQWMIYYDLEIPHHSHWKKLK